MLVTLLHAHKCKACRQRVCKVDWCVTRARNLFEESGVCIIWILSGIGYLGCAVLAGTLGDVPREEVYALQPFRIE